MLTYATERCFRLVVKLLFVSGSGPIRWDKEGHAVTFVESRIFAALSVANFCLMSFYEGFLLFRTGQTLFPENGEVVLPLACHLLYTVSCYAIPIHLHLTTFSRWREIPILIRAYIRYFKEFNGKCCKRGEPMPGKNGCEKLCRNFIAMAGLITLQNVVLIMRKPQRLFFLTSLLDNPKKSLLRIPLTLLHFQIWLSFWAQLLFYGHLLYTYAFPSMHVLRRMKKRRRCTSRDDLVLMGSSEEFMGMYRSYQVLQNMFSYCCKDVFFPGHKVTMSLSVIMSIYGAVKLEGNRAVLMGFVSCTGLAYLAILFRKMGKFYIISNNILKSWKGQNKRTDTFL